MKVSRDQAADNRRRVLDSAGRLFRQKGFDGIGVADIMKDAGLTHGGFYGQFASKDDLAAEACARGLEASVAKWEALVAGAPEAPLGAIVSSYLSGSHRDHPATGCVCPTLAADVARKSSAAQGPFTTGLRALVGLLERVVPGRSPAARRGAALATMAGLVGAVVLSRAVDDPGLSDEILAAAAAAFAEQGRA